LPRSENSELNSEVEKARGKNPSVVLRFINGQGLMKVNALGTQKEQTDRKRKPWQNEPREMGPRERKTRES